MDSSARTDAALKTLVNVPGYEIIEEAVGIAARYEGDPEFRARWDRRQQFALIEEAAVDARARGVSFDAEQIAQTWGVTETEAAKYLSALVIMQSIH